MSRYEVGKIHRGDFGRWLKSDATKTLWIEKIVGIACLPLVALWVGLWGIFTVGLGLGVLLLKGASALWDNFCCSR